MEQYAVIWIKENTRKRLKKVAVDDEMSMRELASIIIDAWIDERQERYRNNTPTQPAEVLPKKKPDVEAKDDAD